MLYGVEGLKIIDDEKPHCPHPVVLEFGPHILELPGVLISDQWAGNPEAQIEAYPKGLEAVDFAAVTDPEAYKEREKKQKKHAEVLVPDMIPISFLHRIIVRSKAELKQLFTLASIKGVDIHNIECLVAPNYFHRHRLLVEDCDVKKLGIKSWQVSIRVLNCGYEKLWVYNENTNKYYGPVLEPNEKITSCSLDERIVLLHDLDSIDTVLQILLGANQVLRVNLRHVLDL
jgi:hypothetical protein